MKKVQDIKGQENKRLGAKSMYNFVDVYKKYPTLIAIALTDHELFSKCSILFLTLQFKTKYTADSKFKFCITYLTGITKGN